jgi:hypothetical protein
VGDGEGVGIGDAEGVTVGVCVKLAFEGVAVISAVSALASSSGWVYEHALRHKHINIITASKGFIFLLYQINFQKI